MTDQPIEDTTDDQVFENELTEGDPNGSPDPVPVTGTDGESDASTEETEPDTFPREYVEKLRDENARYRQRAGKADDLARRVHRLQVEATGLLADPDDLEFNEDHLDDPDALTAAIEDLLARKPHLAARRPRGDVGQGVTDAGGTDLAAILRRAAN